MASGYSDDQKAPVEETDLANYSVDPQKEARVIRKIDMVILPLMCSVYFFQYLDKQSLNYATVFGLNRDLSLSGDQFSWSISIFYFGQLVSEYPAAYFMSRLPVARFVGVSVLLWGIVEMCMAASTSFAGLATCRFFLGFCEGAVSPCFLVITSNWYKRQEQPLRVACWVSFNGVAQIIGALLMYGIGMSHEISIANWRAMFLICGAGTVAIGIIFLGVIPLNTTTAWFLDDEERAIATKRLAVDRATRDRSQFTPSQVWETLKDHHFWVYFLLAFCITLPSPILKFSSLVISGFGYTKFQTMLVGLPSGAILIVFIWTGGILSNYTRIPRCFISIGLCLVPLLGSILLLSLPASAKWGIVVSAWLAGCISPLISMTVAIISSNVKGNTKKATTSTAYFVSYCVGCISGPQLWTEADAPRYTRGCIASIVSYIVFIALMLLIYILFRRENSKRDRKINLTTTEEHNTESKGKSGTDPGISVDSDLTDRQDSGFRYRL